MEKNYKFEECHFKESVKIVFTILTINALS